jgi:hypothetical protein
VLHRAPKVLRSIHKGARDLARDIAKSEAYQISSCWGGGFRGLRERGLNRDVNELLLERTDLLQQVNWVQVRPQLLYSVAHALARRSAINRRQRHAVADIDRRSRAARQRSTAVSGAASALITSITLLLRFGAPALVIIIRERAPVVACRLHG